MTCRVAVVPGPTMPVPCGPAASMPARPTSFKWTGGTMPRGQAGILIESVGRAAGDVQHGRIGLRPRQGAGPERHDRPQHHRHREQLQRAAWVGPDGFSASGQQISGLGSGTYSAAIVTSCGNTPTHTVTLTEPDPIALDLELVHPGCPELPNGEAYLGAEWRDSSPMTLLVGRIRRHRNRRNRHDRCARRATTQRGPRG